MTYTERDGFLWDERENRVSLDGGRERAENMLASCYDCYRCYGKKEKDQPSDSLEGLT